MKIAFSFYFMAAFMILVFGFVYFTRSELMPYHLQVLGLQWVDIQPHFQLLFLAFINGAGATAIGNAAAILILLWIPFRRNEAWAIWAITGIGLVTAAPLLYIVIKIKLTTTASPPLILVVMINLLIILGFLFSSKQLKSR